MSQVTKSEPKEALFSKKNIKILKDPLNESNPVTVQVLGICSSLAITVKLEPAIVMGVSVLVVTAFSNLIPPFQTLSLLCSVILFPIGFGLSCSW